MKYPKLTFLLVGFVMGGAISYFSFSTADIYKEQITKLEHKLAEEEYAHNSLKTEHKELQTSFNESFEEIIKPDGTKIVKRITNKKDRTTSSTLDASEEYARSKSESTAGETVARESIRKDLTLNLSIDTELDLGVSMQYKLLPPFNFGIGIEVDGKNPSNIKQLELGIGVSL